MPHRYLKGGANNGSLELLSPLVPLLGDILLLSLLVLPPVEHGPGDLTGVALQKVSLVGAAGQEPVNISFYFNVQFIVHHFSKSCMYARQRSYTLKTAKDFAGWVLCNKFCSYINLCLNKKLQ